MNDKTLRQIVIDELDFEPRIDAAHIGVTAEGGVITLTGHVGSYAEKIAAEEAVRRVKGVKAIAEEIEVRYPFAKKTADDEIAKRAVHILEWDSSIPKNRVEIKVQRGWITLSGEVDWYFQKQAAEHAVRKLTGIVGVNNMISIKQTVQSGDVRKRIEEAFKRNAELEADGIRVSVSDGKVTLEGKVKAWYERNVAEQAAWAAQGVRAVEDHIQVG
jgi:osmotically-inducible protein OsmY